MPWGYTSLVPTVDIMWLSDHSYFKTNQKHNKNIAEKKMFSATFSCLLWVSEIINVSKTFWGFLRLVTGTIWSRAASWPRIRSCWTRGTPRWPWWINASVTWENACIRREQRCSLQRSLVFLYHVIWVSFWVSLCPLQLSRMNGGTLSSPQSSSHPGAGVSGRVAAVCPYIQVPSEGRQEPGYPLPADPPPKPTPLSHIRSLSGWWMFILFCFFPPF